MLIKCITIRKILKTNANSMQNLYNLIENIQDFITSSVLSLLTSLVGFVEERFRLV